MDFDEWLSLKTQFSKADFFQMVREVMSHYDLEEEEQGDRLIFRGKTLPYERWEYNEMDITDRKLVKFEQDYKAVAEFREDMCSFGCEVKGRGEYGGQQCPYKTRQDLDGMSAPLSSRLKPRRAHYEQMRLF